jgi:hypothetical protein
MAALIPWPDIPIDCEHDARVLEAGWQAVRQSHKLLDGAPATLQGMITAREGSPNIAASLTHELGIAGRGRL